MTRNKLQEQAQQVHQQYPITRTVSEDSNEGGENEILKKRKHTEEELHLPAKMKKTDNPPENQLKPELAHDDCDHINSGNCNTESEKSGEIKS